MHTYTIYTKNLIMVCGLLLENYYSQMDETANLTKYFNDSFKMLQVIYLRLKHTHFNIHCG